VSASDGADAPPAAFSKVHVRRQRQLLAAV